MLCTVMGGLTNDTVTESPLQTRYGTSPSFQKVLLWLLLVNPSRTLLLLTYLSLLCTHDCAFWIVPVLSYNMLDLLYYISYSCKHFKTEGFLKVLWIIFLSLGLPGNITGLNHLMLHSSTDFKCSVASDAICLPCSDSSLPSGHARFLHRFYYHHHSG